MPLQVRPLVDADLEILISHADSGPPGDDTVAPPCPISWPVTTREEAQLRARCHFSWQRKRFREDPTQRFVKVVNVESSASNNSDDGEVGAGEHGEIVAVARWHYYPKGYNYEREKHWEMAPQTFVATSNGDGEETATADGTNAYPPLNFNRAMHNHILTTRDSFRSQWIPADAPAWVLMHLVTRPSQRRRGAAEMLVRWGQEQAARTGADAYLEAGIQGKPLYARCGFAAVGETRMFDLRGYGGMVDEFEIVNMKWSPLGGGKAKEEVTETQRNQG